MVLCLGFWRASIRQVKKSMARVLDEALNAGKCPRYHTLRSASATIASISGSPDQQRTTAPFGQSRRHSNSDKLSVAYSMTKRSGWTNLWFLFYPPIHYEHTYSFVVGVDLMRFDRRHSSDRKLTFLLCIRWY